MIPSSRFENFCQIIMGQAPDGETYNDRGEGLPLIAGAGDYTEDCILTKKFTTARSAKCSKAGDIILGIRATIGEKVTADGIYALGRGVAALRARADVLEPRFLWHWLGLAAAELSRKAKGATFKQVTREDIAELPFPDIAPPEQRRIAAVLDKADAIRRKRREALRLTDEFLRSTLLDVALRVRDGSLAGKIEPLSNLLSKNENAIRTGPFGSDLLHSEFATTGIPVVGIENAVTNRFRWTKPRCISAAKYQELRRYRIFPGDVIVTIMGTTGRVCVAPRDLPECISTKHLCVMTPNRDKVTSNYLWASLLFDPFVRSQAAQAGKGAIMEGWNMTIVKSLDIAIPSSTALNRFDAAVNRCESIRARHELALAESEDLFRSLTSRVFSGELGAV